jgi:gliding motility-associated-like protein
MLRAASIQNIILAVLTFPLYCLSQPFDFSLARVAEKCNKGSVVLTITTSIANPTTNIEWSNGRRDTDRLFELDEGDYSVRVVSKYNPDSLVRVLDTTIYFRIEKELCEISIPKFFSPNSDGYNDMLFIGNVEKHPEFDFNVYNKWGQKVHGQKKQYIPWDGTWNGLPMPDGVYYFVFFYDSGDKHSYATGDITILR